MTKPFKGDAPLDIVQLAGELVKNNAKYTNVTMPQAYVITEALAVMFIETVKDPSDDEALIAFLGAVCNTVKDIRNDFVAFVEKEAADNDRRLH